MVCLWLVNRFIPMQSTVKSVLNGVVVIAVVDLGRVWTVSLFFTDSYRPMIGDRDRDESGTHTTS